MEIVQPCVPLHYRSQVYLKTCMKNTHVDAQVTYYCNERHEKNGGTQEERVPNDQRLRLLLELFK